MASMKINGYLTNKRNRAQFHKWYFTCQMKYNMQYLPHLHFSCEFSNDNSCSCILRFSKWVLVSGFVMMSAIFFFVGQYLFVIIPFFFRCFTLWYFIPICFTRFWCFSFSLSLIHAMLSSYMTIDKSCGTIAS